MSARRLRNMGLRTLLAMLVAATAAGPAAHRPMGHPGQHAEVGGRQARAQPVVSMIVHVFSIWGTLI